MKQNYHSLRRAIALVAMEDASCSNPAAAGAATLATGASNLRPIPTGLPAHSIPLADVTSDHFGLPPFSVEGAVLVHRSNLGVVGTTRFVKSVRLEPRC